MTSVSGKQTICLNVGRDETRGGAGTTVKKKPIRSVRISKSPSPTSCRKPSCYACKKVKTINYDKGGVKRIYSPFTLTKLAASPKPTKKTEKRIPPLESHYKSYGLSPKEKMYIIASCQTRTSQYTYLKSLAANAIKNRKIFSLYGYCNAVRKALVERGWVERIPASRMNLSRIRNGTYTCKADIHSELERLLLSNLVQKYSPNFIWTSREDFKDNTIDMTNDHTTIVNKLRIDAMWTTKQGLCSSMKRNYWFYIENVAEVNGPRTYNSYETGEIEGFISDFKITACTSLLKWVLSMVANDRPVFVRSGKIPMNVLLFALNRCKEYLFKKQNKDIDRSVTPVSSGQWNSFLKKYYQIISKAEVFEADINNQLPLYLGYAKLFLKEIHRYRPQLSCEGCHNIWIVKPAHCSRGRGITMASKLGVLSEMLCKATTKYVVQKYIEEPLLIHDTKFDIRQYYLITSTCPLVVWMYRDCYLKFSSQKYNLRNYHESIHLTNNAVQKKYKNCDNRNDELPLNNMWHSDQYKKYLVGIGQEDVWDTVIYPGMRKSIVGVMLNCQDSLSECRHRFELYGCDFILDSKYNPWLIEINSCPDLQHTTPVTAKICPAVVLDIIKVVIDFAKDPNCSTGKFECIYRQPVTVPRYRLSGDLSVRGYSLPNDYFYRGQIEIKESYDNADIGKEKDINKIMKEMKKLYDEDVTLEPEPDCLNKSKDNIIIRDTHFTDSDVDGTGGASSCSINEQLGELLFNISAEKNWEPDCGETENRHIVDSKCPEVPPKVETVLSKISTSKCTKSIIEDISLDFSTVDDEPLRKPSELYLNPLQRVIHGLSSCPTGGLNSKEMHGEIKKMNNVIYSKTESYQSIEKAVANLINFLRDKEKECLK